jgi:hypothetical protein
MAYALMDTNRYIIILNYCRGKSYRLGLFFVSFCGCFGFLAVPSTSANRQTDSSLGDTPFGLIVLRILLSTHKGGGDLIRSERGAGDRKINDEFSINLFISI